ncbi:class F sortase [Actinoplanes friuliensis]|uniref:Peptidase C60 sortase A and B n=1 Tax=Actinoplanes friuliensis DSM 7358 TaxID=1246995 RepID=U5W8R3_9ACTN|nr:class F sortase [Actinoplanes friuliensis]AGZ45402.1 peptidase C60 sortase A and B [Actinoplanes friuliensis DSM 7358]
MPDDVPEPETGTRRKALRAALPIVVSLLVAFVVATGYLMVREPRGSGDLGRWSGSASPAAVQPSEDMEGLPNPFHTAAPELGGPPTRLQVKAIGVDTSLETLHLGTDGELQPPKTNNQAGWYADGTAPGDIGPAVLAGHVDSKQGPAVFYRLREIEAGDKIEVTRGARTVTFTVTSTAWYPKKAFPTGKVYGPTPDRQLRLITCGGVFDQSLRSYKDNLVVYAVAG